MKTYVGRLIENPSIVLDDNNKVIVMLMFTDTCFTLGGMVGMHSYENFCKGYEVEVQVDKNGVVRKAEYIT